MVWLKLGRGILDDMGHKVTLELKSDASAALGIARRRGVGKLRHIEVTQLWLQDRVFKGDLKLTKVPGTENLADGLTKYIGSEYLRWHVSKVGQRVRGGRHAEAPTVNMDDWDAGISDPKDIGDDAVDDVVGEDEPMECTELDITVDEYGPTVHDEFADLRQVNHFVLQFGQEDLGFRQESFKGCL